MFELKLRQNLKDRDDQHLLRQSLSREPSQGIIYRHQGQELLSFCSNDYLGLANDPRLILACQTALQEYGVGSGSAYLISGLTRAHQELEEQLAGFLGYPAVLIMSCGYLANIGVITALFSKKNVLLADKLNHASLLDGCMATKGTLSRYPHLQLSVLDALCLQYAAESKAIITEGLFGMDGTLAPLNQIAQIAGRNKTPLMVDDAHGIGLLGKNGKGSLEVSNLSYKEVTILTGTFGKAFGSYGAFVASNPLIIETIRQFARTYVYTTALPPSLAAASLASLNIIRQEPWRREKVDSLIRYFKLCALQLGVPLTDSLTAVQPIILGANKRTQAVSDDLFARGLLVKAIRPPTVPIGSARLRITLTYHHTTEHIDYLLESLANAIKRY